MNMCCSSRKEKKILKVTQIVGAASLVSKGDVLASVSTGQRTFDGSLRGEASWDLGHLPASRTVFLWLKPPSLWYFLTAVEQTKTGA